MKLLLFLKQLLSPIVCTLCDKEGVSLCKECILLLPQGESNLAEKVHVLLSYKDSKVKKLLRDAKYHHQTALYEPLVEAFIQKSLFLHSTSLQSAIIIPVPTHFLRTLFRGQDHTRVLGAFLSQKTKLRCETSLLQKKRRTKRQALLARSERLYAQKNSFFVPDNKKELVAGKEILLIDDIATTGSTLFEAKKALLAAGAREVHLLALAH